MASTHDNLRNLGYAATAIAIGAAGIDAWRSYSPDTFGRVLAAWQSFAARPNQVELHPPDMPDQIERSSASDEKSQATPLDALGVPQLGETRHLVGEALWRGNQQFKQERFTDALMTFSHVTELAPEFAGGYGGRGACKKQLGDLEGALQDFTNAIRLDPGQLVFRLSRAQTLSLLGRNEEAIGDVDAYLRRFPNDQEVYDYRDFLLDHR